MQAQTRTLTIGDMTFRIRWDAGAGHQAETHMKRMAREAGASREEVDSINILEGVDMTLSTALAFLYGAIYAGAAERDEDPPITFRRLASLLDTTERQNEAFAAVSGLIETFHAEPDEPGKEEPAVRPARAKKASTSGASTRSARSTSASPTASSGA